MLDIPIPPSSDAERIHWLQLIRSQNVGPRTFYKLIKLYGSATKALEAIPEMAKRGGKKTKLKCCTIDQAQNEWDQTERYGAHYIFAGDSNYPPQLCHIDDAPPVLTVFGNKLYLKQDIIAFVGTRNASLSGCRLTQQLAQEIGKQGYAVSSGLARGIDTAAHQGSLAQGTIAVIAGGINHIYPKENSNLYHQIAEKGCILAESPFNAVPKAEHFPRRNRIISGISWGVVVVEAAVRSGSLITARLAGEQGREVMAIPGNPMDPRAAGPNKLLKSGATLITSADDIIEAVNYMKHHPTAIDNGLFERDNNSFTHQAAITPSPNEIENARHQIQQSLNTTPIDINDLIVHCGVPASIIQAILLELELAGRLERHPGNRIALLATNAVA